MVARTEKPKRVPWNKGKRFKWVEVTVQHTVQYCTAGCSRINDACHVDKTIAYRTITEKTGRKLVEITG